MNHPSGPVWSTVTGHTASVIQNGLAPPPRVNVVDDRGCRHKTRRDREPCKDRQPGRRRAMLSPLVGKAQT